MNEAPTKEGLPRFAHEAMATTFEVVVAGQDGEYARQAAGEVFREIDRIEQALSRFIELSDISQINAARAGVEVRIGLRAFECLQTAARMYVETEGAFDVTIGPLMDCWRNPDKTPRTPSEAELAAARARVGMPLVEFDPKNVSVRLKADGMRLDLGGIGKGFALDKAAELLGDWGIEAALIHGGGSTVMAMGAPPGSVGWPLGVGGAGKGYPSVGKVLLRDNAVSGSGVEYQGAHIFDPRSGKPVAGKIATWAVCAGAAKADALSTAFMVMELGAIETYCAEHPGTCAMVLPKDGGKERYTRFGPWEKLLDLAPARAQGSPAG